MNEPVTRDSCDARLERGGRPVEKKPYRSPVLIAYGSVAKLTQGIYTNGFDGPAGGRRNPCL